MSGHKYGALRGRVVASAEERNEHVSPHYQILVMADGDPWRIAVNVKSTDTGGSARIARLCSTGSSTISGIQFWRR